MIYPFTVAEFATEAVFLLPAMRKISPPWFMAATSPKHEERQGMPVQPEELRPAQRDEARDDAVARQTASTRSPYVKLLAMTDEQTSPIQRPCQRRPLLQAQQHGRNKHDDEPYRCLALALTFGLTLNWCQWFHNLNLFGPTQN